VVLEDLAAVLLEAGLLEDVLDGLLVVARTAGA
jgi:hypothetical protein